MVMPYIMSVSREVLLAVPDSQREAALALGATRWEAVTGAVLPYARSGIIGAVILGLGRALGETMAVTMLIGNRHEIAASLFAPGLHHGRRDRQRIHRGGRRTCTSSALTLRGADCSSWSRCWSTPAARLLIWRVARGSARGSRAL